MRSVRITSPAKLNLGLSILGKRPDGYHEINTIMTMIDLADVLSVRETGDPGIEISGMNDVPLESNLVTRAIRGWCEITGRDARLQIEIEKNIPSPAGLGGGSSNAAAMIRVMNALYPGEMSVEQMHSLAASLGADCPFFLGTATARATGIGTHLQPLDSPSLSAVLVVPPTDVAAKTATLYGALKPEDYGTREIIDAIQAGLVNGAVPTITNSFTRAARQAFPAINPAWEAVESLAGSCGRYGAGPARFSLTKVLAEASRGAEDLRSTLGDESVIRAVSTISESPLPVIAS